MGPDVVSAISIPRILVSSATVFLPGSLCFTKEQDMRVHPSQNLWAVWLWQLVGFLGETSCQQVTCRRARLYRRSTA